MRRKLLRVSLLTISLTLLVISGAHFAFAATPQGSTGYLITNDDDGKGTSDTATFFTIAADGSLSNPKPVTLGGTGSLGGYFAASRVAVLNSQTSPCVFLSEGSSNTIAGVQALTQTVVGDFSASASDKGVDNGIGMVVNGNYLYAGFSSSATIATFAVQSGCGLQFISDISPSGLNGGTAKAMALYNSLMVLTYGDGSIESFDISDGVPVSNGDAQYATGFDTDNFPDGVVITPDGHYAVFGDDSSGATVEVSDISSGRLTQTVLYNLPSGFNSNNVLLSPDGTLLYIVNNTSGQVSAAFFDTATGVVSGSCISAQLSGFDNTFSFPATLATQLPTGTGSVLYVAEFGQPSAIGVLTVSVSNGQCTLTETAASPVSEPNSQALLSIAVVPTLQPGLYSPAPGSTLTGNSVTFYWDGVPAATAFWIDVGSSVGGNQYYQSGSLAATTLSATVTSLPTNGSPVYVTFYWLINGSWVSNSYTYTAFSPANGAGAMTTPAPGSVLGGSNVTFDWTAGTAATAYWLDLGNVAGGNQYYQSGNLGNVLTTTANGLPTNGITVYATLYSLINGAWISNAYTYTAYGVATAPGVLTTPNPGTTLSGSTVTFDWTSGSGATAYWLDLGSVAGGNQYEQSGNLGNVTQLTVNGLPTNGTTIYATLYSLISGTWVSNAYTYTAFTAAQSGGVITTPAPGTTLSGNTVTFSWTAGAGATAYWLDAGNVAGGNQYEQSGNLGNVTQLTVNGLPMDGSEIFVTLYSLIGGAWSPNAYTYTASSGSGGLAMMQTPVPGSTLSGNKATFTWSADQSATAYWVDISALAPGGNDVYQSGNLGNVLTTTVSSLPANGSIVYVTLYSYVGGQWLSTASTYVSGQ
ncbi:MAG: beta-propeller fold lactonase family protein [Terriglobales bacterium]